MVKVSVIIPVFNAMTYLPFAVESVLRQSFCDFELIIVNDGSSDGVIDWISQLQDHRVKVISQENQGVSVARNTGISYSSGKYIAFLDADDIWGVEKLEKQVQCLEKNLEVGLVHTNVGKINELDSYKREQTIISDKDDLLPCILQKNIVFCGSTPMVYRSCFEDVGLFDQSLSHAEDWDMWIRIAFKYSFALLKEPLVYYRQHPASLSKNCQAMLNQMLKVVEKNFRNVSTELQYLKFKAYGQINLYVGWVELQRMDYPRAKYYQQQALIFDPSVRFTDTYIRLTLIVLVRSLLRSTTYKNLTALLRRIGLQ